MVTKYSKSSQSIYCYLLFKSWQLLEASVNLMNVSKTARRLSVKTPRYQTLANMTMRHVESEPLTTELCFD